jgi:competence CoiA-like predicted nuclease
MTKCLINIELALALKHLANTMELKGTLGKYGFFCPECHQPLKAHSDGMQGPHFEHVKRNKKCSLSDT